MSSIAMLFEYWFDPTDDSAYREYLRKLGADLQTASARLDAIQG
jgi:hypothetical protein